MMNKTRQRRPLTLQQVRANTGFVALLAVGGMALLLGAGNWDAALALLLGFVFGMSYQRGMLLARELMRYQHLRQALNGTRERSLN